jgi:DNA-binding transcriptional MerR regulator
MQIGEVSQRTGLTIDTLRYYEDIGLLPPQRRDRGGRRRYDADILRWLDFVARLKATGMPLAAMVRYAAFRAAGDGTSADRLALLEEHGVNVAAQIGILTEALDVINGKIATYRDALKGADDAGRQPQPLRSRARTPGSS